MAKSILELAGVSSWAELRARSVVRQRTPRAGEISAAAADRRAKGSWFRGYTPVVRCPTDAHVVGDLEVDRSYVLYPRGLRVTGVLRLGASRSIVVVIGDLHVGSLELGDDVLVVTGDVLASEYVLSRPNEGIFSVRGEQAVEAQLRHVRTPWYVAYDQDRGTIRVFVTRATPRVPRGRLVEKAIARSSSLRNRGKLDLARVRARLVKGQPL